MSRLNKVKNMPRAKTDMSCCGPEHMKHKKMKFGAALVIFGALLYLRNTGYIATAYFWPLIAILFGLGIIAMGYYK